ncbi:MAG: hypothetical protein WCC92_07880 [Candidatus Korobacteraceae bacterium]
MRLSRRVAVLFVLALNLAPIAVGQKPSPSPPRKPSPRKLHCQPDGGFCFRYPSSWEILGEVFNGNGVVIAPPQKVERTLWDEITVALILPPTEGNEEPISLDGLIEQASKNMREGGQNFETLQRQERTVDHKPAQMLKVRYHEKATDRDWVEQLVFIQGPDGEMYSVALKCSPSNLAHLEPVFAGVLESWVLPEPEVPAGAADDDAPKQGTPPRKAPISH